MSISPNQHHAKSRVGLPFAVVVGLALAIVVAVVLRARLKSEPPSPPSPRWTRPAAEIDRQRWGLACGDLPTPSGGDRWYGIVKDGDVSAAVSCEIRWTNGVLHSIQVSVDQWGPLGGPRLLPRREFPRVVALIYPEVPSDVQAVVRELAASTTSERRLVGGFVVERLTAHGSHTGYETEAIQVAWDPSLRK